MKGAKSFFICRAEKDSNALSICCEVQITKDGFQPCGAAVFRDGCLFRFARDVVISAETVCGCFFLGEKG